MKNTKIHFMGIGGAGASACAAIAASAGFVVSGCDIAKSKYLTNLRNIKIDIDIGHNTKHLKDCQMLVITPAIPNVNPGNLELLAAKKAKIPVLTWQEFMAKFLQTGKRLIAVAGSHGKSTTTGMIGHILEDAGFDPTVEVGALDLAWDKNFRIGEGKVFICEADEYNNNFLNYKPEIAVITNIDFDHPDFFKNAASVLKSFVKFTQGNKNLKKLIVNPQNLGIKKLLRKINNKDILEFSKSTADNQKLKMLAEYNLNNAALAAAVGESLGIGDQVIQRSLANFKGLERRLEFLGQIGNTQIFDDFAHHPTEIAATLQTLKVQHPKYPICIIFQPHTYSRTRALFSDFVKVFRAANLSQIIFTDIFASREKNDLGISSHDLAAAVGAGAIYVSNLEGVSDWLAQNLSKFGVIATIGAGDIGKIWDFDNLKLKFKNDKN